MNPITKKLTPILFALAAACIVIGIVLLALVVPGAASAFFKVCFVIMAITLLLLGVGIFYLLYNSRDTEPNFFLYDPKTSRNIEVDELTFDRVNSRMSYFMSTLTSSQDRLWSDNVLTVNPARFGVNEIYRPLAAYKMIYDLAEIDTPAGWRLFLNATPATISTLTDTLRASGEEAMAKTLIKAYNSASNSDDYEWISDFLKGNKPYISRRMTAYVRKNMEWFY